MPPKTIKKALTDMLAGLSKADFESFCHQLVDRREEPTVSLNKVEGKSRLVIANVLVTTFTEAKAPEVAVELLREIGCPNDAEKLDSKTKACVDKGDPTFRKTSTGKLETKPSQEALNHTAGQWSAGHGGPPAGHGGPPVTVKKPEEVEAEAKARVLSEGGDPRNERLVLSRCTIQFGKYKGQTFKWLLENDVSYIGYLVAGHQKERKDTLSQSPLMANKDSLTTYAIAYPEVLREVRFQRACDRSRQSGQKGKALVGFGLHQSETLQDLYNSKDKRKISYVNFLRKKKSTCEPGTKMDVAVKYILQCDKKQASAAKRKRVQSPRGQPAGDSSPSHIKSKEDFDIFCHQLVDRREKREAVLHGEHFVDKHRAQLIDRVNDISPILDQLLNKKVIQPGSYDEILAIPRTRDKMRKLYSGPLNAAGPDGKDVFYKILEEYEPSLIADLKKMNIVEGATSTDPEKNPQYKPIQKEVTMTSLKEKLLETLGELSYMELVNFKWLLRQTEKKKGLLRISRQLTEMADRDEIVKLIVKTYGQQSVEMTTEVLMMMNRRDLVQKLSEISSGSKEKPQSKLIQKEEVTMTSLKEKLLETLEELSYRELEHFKCLLRQTEMKKGLPRISIQLMEMADTDEIVELMVKTYGQQSVEVTKKVLKKMNRRDLVQKLSEISSGSKVKPQSKLIQKEVAMTSLKEKLLETLGELSYRELVNFKWLLQQTEMKKGLPRVSKQKMAMADRDEIVELMMKTYGQQSVEVTKKVLKKMNRTDLVQKLSEISSGSKVKPQSKPIQKEVTMTSLKEKLLETLEDLHDLELEHFKQLLRYAEMKKGLPRISRQLTEMADRDEIVKLMVETYGQQSVEVTTEVLMEMNRRDLVQKLSEISSGSKDKPQSKLIQKEVTMTPLEEKLLEHLEDLSYVEFEHFKQLLQDTVMKKGLLRITRQRMKMADKDEIVELMVETYGQQSVEVTMEVLMMMNRTDQVQKLSEISSGSKDKPQSKPIQKEVTMTSLKEKLLETLEDLNDLELEHFKQLLRYAEMKKGLPRISRQLTEMADRDEIVKLMVKTYGQQSVEMTTEVLMEMNRRDLVQKLSEISSGSKEKPQSKPIQKEVTMTPLKEKLLEHLEDLSYVEFEQFKQFLQDTEMKKRLLRISRQRMKMADRDEIVKLIVKTYGQQSVEVTTEVLMKMNRTDLVQKLSEISSGSKDKRRSKPIQTEVTMTPLEEKLLETLEELHDLELEHFKQLLRYAEMKKGLPRISRQLMEMADRDEIVKLMVKTYGQQSVEMTTEVLMKMNRRDLVQKLSEISSGSRDKRQSKPIQKQDSSDWTELEPEVNSTDADEAPTYRRKTEMQDFAAIKNLQSEAGNFECSVSGLRWVCKEKVSFKYQFCSLKKHMERIESMQYMPAGPLMDITVIAGKLDEVYLPHWICIDDNPTILDKFAVLHIDDCGDVVEKVSEVTSSHIKLSEPAFSLKMVLVKAGCSVEIHSKVLIYGTKTPFFTLHVYLIPPDIGLLQDLEKTESSDGYRRFRKPHPKKPLRMHDEFILTAELGGDKIASDTLQLLYESTEPNFSEVVIEDPVADLTLKLGKENESQPVWTCVIRQKEYQSTDGPIQGQHFVDRHRVELIDRVSNIASILDQLLSKKIIQQGSYDEILAIPTNRGKMRKLFSGPLNAAGPDGKDVFYKILQKKESSLIASLKKSVW